MDITLNPYNQWEKQQWINNRRITTLEQTASEATGAGEGGKLILLAYSLA